MRTDLFASFLMAGFECSTHRRADGRRLDVIHATRHDIFTRQDYEQLAAHGIRTVRDGVRWHLIQPRPGLFDWSSLDPMLQAAEESDTQVIWDLLHYGWPDWIDPFDPAFPDHYARFAEQVARRVGTGGRFVPINEISFLAWGGGDVGYLNPFARGRGDELKRALCRAVIDASRAIRSTVPGAVLLAAEPLIRIHARPDNESLVRELHRAQYQAVDILLGRECPELGGGPDVLDAVGLNYYPNNQWQHDGPPETLPAALRSPLADLLVEADTHYQLPLFIAETGCEGEERAAWFKMVMDQLDVAAERGTVLHGVCLYPVLNHPGWDDDRECPNGLLCGYSAAPRVVHGPLAASIEDVHAGALR